MFRSSRLCRLCLIEVNAVVPIFATKDVAETSSIQMKIMELANVQVYAGDGLPSNVCSNCNTLLDSYHAFKTQIEKSDVILRHQLSTSQTDPLSLDGKEVEGTGHGEFVKAETLIIKDEEIDEDHVESIIHPTSAPSLSSPLPDTSIINDDEDEDENEDDDDGDDHDNDPGADEMDVDDDETQTDPLASDPVESPLDQLSTSNKPATSVADANVTTPQSIPLVTSTSSIPLVSSATPIIANPPGNLLLVATPLIINSGNEPGKPNSVTPTSSFVALPTNVSSTFVTVPTSAIKAPTPTATVTSGSIKKKPKRKTTVKKEKVSEVSAEPGPSTSTAEPTEESASTSAGGDPLQVIETQSLACGDSTCIGVLQNSTSLNNDKEKNEAGHKCNECGITHKNNVELLKHKEWHKRRKCDICNKTFSEPNSVKRHKIKVHDREKFSCDQCDKVFVRKDSLNYHITQTHPIKNIECDVCGEKFKNKRAMQSHKLNDHKGDNLPTCDLCNKSFKTRSHLRYHKLCVHSDATMACDVCGSVYKNIFTLNNHKKRAHGKDESVVCDICGKLLASKPGLAIHKKNVHIDIQNQSPKDKCNICNRYFFTLAKLRQHKRIVHNDTHESVICDLCGKSCRNKFYLKNHKYRIHPSNDGGSVICDNCGKSYRNTYLLTLHKRAVHVVDPVQCKICDKIFSNKVKLKTHVRSLHFSDTIKLTSEVNANTAGTNECLSCGRLVKNLAMHMKYIHGERKDVTCEMCNKKFESERNLNTHKYISHSNRPRDQICKICGASFQFKHGLKYHHLRVHTVERNYSCEFCGKTFKERAKLNIHMRLHNNYKPYDCNKCGMSFRWKQTYKKHLEKCTVINESD